MASQRSCIVVGAGLLGLSAAWSLARRGWSTVVLEAGGSVGHAGAGSKGDARIFRLGYPEAHYVEMAVAARQLWQGLEAASGRRLLHVTGQVTFGDAASLQGIAGAMAAHGAPVEVLGAREAARRYPGLAPPPGPVLFEPESGVLAADECLRALCSTGGFEVRTGIRVRGLRDEADAVSVDADGAVGTGRSAWRADVVVDCAGAGALDLLGGDRPVGTAPSLPQVAYFRAAAGAGDAGGLPVFIEWGAEMIYGLPVHGSGAHAGTFKVSHHTPGPPLDRYEPAEPTPEGDDPALLAALVAAARRLLPALDPEPVATERCVYDNSVDTDFVLDRTGNVVVGCGTSGHGFKFGPLLGELLADLAEGAPTRVDLRPFRLDRTTRPGS